jgi:hypothetical protein
VVENVVKVVQHRQQPADKLRGCVLDRFQLLLAGALLVVVEVGGKAQMPVFRFGQRRLELCDLGLEEGVVRRLRSSSGGSCGCLRVVIEG